MGRFEDALRTPGLGAIAEIKRRSPSAGDLRPGADPARSARPGSRTLPPQRTITRPLTDDRAWPASSARQTMLEWISVWRGPVLRYSGTDFPAENTVPRR